MTGFETAFKGRPLSGLPDELVAAMGRHHVGSVALSLRQGDAGAIDTALTAIADEKAQAANAPGIHHDSRRVKAPASVPVLLAVIEKTADESLRKAALAALAPYDNPQIAKKVIERFPKLGKASQPAALSLLASRAASAHLFVRAVENGSIPHAQVPLEIVRKIKLFTAAISRRARKGSGAQPAARRRRR